MRRKRAVTPRPLAVGASIAALKQGPGADASVHPGAFPGRSHPLRAPSARMAGSGAWRLRQTQYAAAEEEEEEAVHGVSSPRLGRDGSPRGAALGRGCGDWGRVSPKWGAYLRYLFLYSLWCSCISVALPDVSSPFCFLGVFFFPLQMKAMEVGQWPERAPT